MKKRIAKVLCAAVLGGSLAVTAFPGVTMAAEKDGGFKVAYSPLCVRLGFNYYVLYSGGKRGFHRNAVLLFNAYKL